MQSDDKRGKLSIVGIGPGGIAQMTGQAADAIRDAEYVIGNAFYLEQIAPLLGGQEVIRSSMGREVERAQKCVDLARTHRVVMVSGGDPGVYGMASIVLEVMNRAGAPVEYEVVPGVTASCAGASLLGSPLTGDHVTLSLSDLLTPWETIETRLDLAFLMGVPVALYNPKSHGRPENLSMALAIALRHRSPGTPVGLVRNAYRDGQETAVTTLGDLAEDDSAVDMRTLVIVGGTETFRMQDGGMLTPRGYGRKYVY
ncbi:precorrin-3B C(17)-methyltransferase [Methanofollis aquaemaris]|uniref:Precorrin-3B C(17)-methyltransferase n=1 Tax=Methanofollis aquaemaris TaxID=126734 RepID=A0A8A3S8J2_9EURY|nr:precorrin-3B C(17)-methyltransferase [Methanofollis aquaemaris]